MVVTSLSLSIFFYYSWDCLVKVGGRFRGRFLSLRLSAVHNFFESFHDPVWRKSGGRPSRRKDTGRAEADKSAHRPSCTVFYLLFHVPIVMLSFHMCGWVSCSLRILIYLYVRFLYVISFILPLKNVFRGDKRTFSAKNLLSCLSFDWFHPSPTLAHAFRVSLVAFAQAGCGEALVVL